MKNVQVIDGAVNCEYAVFQFTDEQFSMIFPGVNQDVEFVEDVEDRMDDAGIDQAFAGAWTRRVDKKRLCGIDGTLFYELTEKRPFYPNKRESDISGHRMADNPVEFDGE